jgi:hypothetical protein
MRTWVDTAELVLTVTMGGGIGLVCLVVGLLWRGQSARDRLLGQAREQEWVRAR